MNFGATPRSLKQKANSTPQKKDNKMQFFNYVDKKKITFYCCKGISFSDFSSGKV